MLTFYKLNGTQAEVGSGIEVPEGYTAYTVGQEPQELKDAISLEALSESKTRKAQEIRDVLSNITPVKVGTVYYHGGFESAMKLDGAKRLAETAGLTEVTFFDVNNIGHSLTLAQAQTVVLAVGADFQAKFAEKQARMTVLENAKTLEEVEAV